MRERLSARTAAPPHRMSERKGFTLVELLVVVAILTLLLAMLTPTLDRARRLTRGAVCLSNLRQIGVGHHSYASASRGAWIPTISRSKQWWTTSVMPYMSDRRLLFCPEATRQVIQPQLGTLYIGGRHTGWFDGYQYPSYPLDQGSYGQNMWLNNFDNAWDPYWGNWGFPKDQHFGGTSSSIPKPHRVPIVGECQWVGGYPYTQDLPWDSEWNGVMYAGHQLNRFAFNRHDRQAGLVFVDGRAAKTHLPDMWKLIWNRTDEPRDVVLPWLDQEYAD